MTTPESPAPGTIGWIDLTSSDAEGVRDFYRDVVGWTAQPVDMGEHQDWCMAPESGEPVAGICHARGPNASMPPCWLIYITVADLDASLSRVEGLGGRVLIPPRSLGGHGRMAVIEDPAGAVSALHQSA